MFNIQGPLPAPAYQAVEKVGLRVQKWGDFMTEGKRSPVQPRPVKPTDICTIMYTSGTTGRGRWVLCWDAPMAKMQVHHISSVANVTRYMDMKAGWCLGDCCRQPQGRGPHPPGGRLHHCCCPGLPGKGEPHHPPTTMCAQHAVLSTSNLLCPCS
jgi:acyl-CoA synthetase (AMP-forming)/AMP-acid ligase II